MARQSSPRKIMPQDGGNIMIKHLILAKFKPGYSPELSDIRRIFEGTLAIEGITDVKLFPNCVERSNRYDLMIQLTMERTALECYDACIWHREWKERYGDQLESKAIFDYEV